ncbi:hypothetical protein LCGC14_2510960 [marine sediment metagenome]|uniref:STAS domain-containing protein n=1 Tax=marine sediment metagenome TaxID=412755 RepID=A0A0F9BM14_9ZZZZ
MNLETRLISDALIITVHAARIDAAAAVQFRDAMRAATKTGPGRVVLDLRPVQFLDSSGLGAIIGTMKHLAPRRLELAALQPAVAKVFRLTRLDSVVMIHDRAEHAVPDADWPGQAHAC